MLLLNRTVKSFRLLTSFPLKPHFFMTESLPHLAETRSLQTCHLQVGTCPSHQEARTFTEKTRAQQRQHLLGECPGGTAPSAPASPRCSAPSPRPAHSQRADAPAARAWPPTAPVPCPHGCTSIGPHLGAGLCVYPPHGPSGGAPPCGRRLLPTCPCRASPQQLSASHTRWASWPGARGATHSGLFSKGRNSHAGNAVTSGCVLEKQKSVSLDLTCICKMHVVCNFTHVLGVRYGRKITSILQRFIQNPEGSNSHTSRSLSN